MSRFCSIKKKSIHLFNYREIGTKDELLIDVIKLYGFICIIESQLPPIFDLLEVIPPTYQNSSWEGVGESYDFFED